MTAPTEFRKYLTNTSWLLTEKIIRSLANLLVSIYIARYLGPTQFGILSYSLTFALLLFHVANMGLEGIVVRDLVHEPKQRDTLLGSAFGLKELGAVLVILLISCILPFTQHDRLTGVMIYIIAMGFFFQSFDVINFYFQSKVWGKYSVAAQLLQISISSVSKVILVVLKASLIWFAAIYCLEIFVLAVGLVGIYLNQGFKITAWKFDFSVARNLFLNSYPLILSGAVVSAYMRVDQILIQWMLGNTAVGYYAVAVTLTEGWYFIPVILTTSLYPAIVQARKMDPKLYQDRLQKFYDLLVLLAIFISLPLSLWGDQLIQTFYGSNFAPAGQVFKIYIWATIFVFLGGANEKWFLIENLQKFNLYRILLGLFSNIILNLLFIPRWGIEGSAIATFISYSLASFWGMAFFKKCRPNFLFSVRSFNIVQSTKRVLESIKQNL